MTNMTDQERGDGRLVPVGNGYEIQFERVYPHPIAEVWDAITDPARIAKWWLPFEAHVELDLRPGGTYELRSHGPEPTVLSWTVLRVEPPRLFEHTHEEPDTVVRWQLHDEGNQCRLQLVQTGPARDFIVKNNFMAGLHTSLDRLALELAGVSDNPWDWDASATHALRYAQRGMGTLPDS